MSYVATVLKDLANGREPMHMGNMTGESWVRLVNQSGMWYASVSYGDWIGEPEGGYRTDPIYCTQGRWF